MNYLKLKHTSTFIQIFIQSFRSIIKERKKSILNKFTPRFAEHHAPLFHGRPKRLDLKQIQEPSILLKFLPGLFFRHIQKKEFWD